MKEKTPILKVRAKKRCVVHGVYWTDRLGDRHSSPLSRSIPAKAGEQFYICAEDVVLDDRELVLEAIRGEVGDQGIEYYGEAVQ